MPKPGRPLPSLSVHPRARGEHVLGRSSNQTPLAVHPRARGEHILKWLFDTMNVREAVHPRARGEHSITSQAYES